MKDLRQSPQYASYLKSIGWKIEKVNNTYIFLKKLPILGWFAKIQRPEKLDPKTITFIEKKYKPFQFSIEPLTKIQANLISNFKFKISNSPSLPTKTLQLNLTKSEESLLKSFSQKTRYNILLAKRKNIHITKSNNIFDFTKFWRENFEKRRFPILSQQKNIIALYTAFGKNSHVLLAKRKNQIVACLFLLFHNKVTYYMYAASSDQGRSLFAPTLLTWDALLLAKSKSCKIFDFDGIYDARFPIKSWLGFTKFKNGFQGEKIEYPGCFVRSILKF